MMLSQSSRSLPLAAALFGTALLAFGAAACGESKPAEAPGCPTGTVLHGKDCLPEGEGEEATKQEESSSESSPSTTKTSTKAPKADPEPVAEEAPPPKKKKPSAAPPSESAADSGGGGSSYDKESIMPILGRATRQIKANCGSATDEDGESGPWGKTKVTVTLGRNGHTRAVALTPEFEGKPAGNCISQAFKSLVFPPYNASADESVDLDVVVKKPAGK